MFDDDDEDDMFGDSTPKTEEVKKKEEKPKHKVWCLLSLPCLLLCVVIIKLVILTLLHSERPKLYTILVFLSAIGLNDIVGWQWWRVHMSPCSFAIVSTIFAKEEVKKKEEKPRHKVW